ncbi:MAG: hypothetical protein ABI619_07210 [Betaproteobacteria bacterium]
MPAWLIPAIKAVLPHIGTIVSAAKPVFTRKEGGSADQATLHQQITELQAAASANDAHIRELAEQVKTAVEALVLAEGRQRRVQWFSLIALIISTASVCIALWVAFAR